MQDRRIGRYRIIGKLGAGGMGEVWRARDDSLGRDVALKMLPADTASDPEKRMRFEREAKAVASLQHPNIVTIHSIEEADGVYFLTMELVSGRTLDSLLPADGLPLQRVFELGVPLAEAIHAAHEQGVIHRDLKPGNVMVDDTGRLRVLDFGLAKLAATGGDAAEQETVVAADESTQEGKILGTVAYMSPEQAEGKPLDRRSDIFSLGIVLYEMATGQRPFKGDTPISTLSAILKESPPSITSLKPLPRHLGRIIHRCLEKNPDRRFQTARDIANELEGLRKEVESGEVQPVSGSSGVSLGLPAGAVARAGGGRRNMWLPLLAVVVVVAVAGGLWVVLSDRPGRQERPITTRPLTSAAGVEYPGSWSPDGSFFVYTHAARGPLDMFVQSTAGGDPFHIVESPADDGAGSWSPDNRWIAFISTRENTAGVYLVPPLGGPVRKLADSGIQRLVDEVDLVLGCNPWSPDGRRLVYTRRKDGKFGLWIVDVSSGEQTPLLMPPPDTMYARPSWSPDGKRIAFTRQSASGAWLWIVAADGGEPEEVPNGETVESRSASWSPDGGSLVFVSNRSGGINSMFAVRIADGEARQLTSGASQISDAIVGKDGRILYGEAGHQTDLYLQQVEGGDERRLTFHTYSNFDARISPDGSRIAYNSDRTGNDEIWVLEPATENELRITDNDAGDYAPDWSSDGKRIVFVSARTGTPRLWIADADGGTQRQVSDVDGVVLPRFAPQGSGIGFVADAEDGTALWFVEADGKGESKARQLLPRVSDFGWYRDARRVIYTPADSPDEIRARDLESGREVVLLDTPHREMAVSPDGRALTFLISQSHYNMNLHLLRLTESADGLPRAEGAAVAITEGRGLWHVHNGGFSPDGESVVYTRDTDTGDLFELDGAF